MSKMENRIDSLIVKLHNITIDRKEFLRTCGREYDKNTEEVEREKQKHNNKQMEGLFNFKNSKNEDKDI